MGLSVFDSSQLNLLVTVRGSDVYVVKIGKPKKVVVKV